MPKVYTSTTQPIDIPGNTSTAKSYLYVGAPEKAPHLSHMSYVKHHHDFQHLLSHSIFSERRKQIEKALTGKKKLVPNDFDQNQTSIEIIRRRSIY